MARIPFGTIMAVLALSAAAAFLGITVTHSDPGTTAATATACGASDAAGQNAFCWVDKAATITDEGAVWRTIRVTDGRHGASHSVLTGWVTLDILPLAQIPFAEADWPSFDPHRGDKVVARMVRGKVVSVAGARGRYFVLDATPASYPLVFIALVLLAAGLIAAAFGRHLPRAGLRRQFARIAPRILLPLTVVAVITFYVHESEATVWGIAITGGLTAAGFLAGARWRRPTHRSQPTRPRQPTH
ncbi:hypothetical protein [Catenulispora pinisilvae]|uniref:hypothetical protein n=1 Tax=Catenulispora pinisilvae TaxID=2705253 RepID=UPI0018921467|nr:hypothetical protein [Catenulispora pinisilvae]